MAASQKKKNVAALHTAARSQNLNRILEISSKSEDEIGRRLSAFSLKIPTSDGEIFLECAYQGSKVFRGGGPYRDIYDMSPREAKKDPRIKKSGELVVFDFGGKQFPLSPKNAFYDWLYISSLFPHREWIDKKISYQGFTDIEFNPAKSINCQARAFAEFIALSERGQLEQSVRDFDFFADLLPPI